MTTQQQIKEQYLGNTCDVEMVNVKHTFTCLEVTFNSLNHAILHYYSDKFPDTKVVKQITENGHIIYDIHLFFLKGRDTIYSNHENYRCTYDYKHYNSFVKQIKVYGKLADIDHVSLVVTDNEISFFCYTALDEYVITIPSLIFIEEQQDLSMCITKETDGFKGYYYSTTNINDILSNTPEHTNDLLKKIVNEHSKFDEMWRKYEQDIEKLTQKMKDAKNQYLNCEHALNILVPQISKQPISFEQNGELTTLLIDGNVKIVKSTKI